MAGYSSPVSEKNSPVLCFDQFSGVASDKNRLPSGSEPWLDLLPVRPIAAHLCHVIAGTNPAALIGFMQLGQLIVIEFHAQTRLVRQVDAPARDRHFAAHQDFVALPRVMGVASIGEVVYRRRQMRHGHQADAQMRVGVHGQTQAKCLTGTRQRLRRAQTTPVVMVRQQDLYRIEFHTPPQLGPIGYHHVGCQRQTSRFVQLGH